MSTRHPSLSLRSAPELLRARAEVVDQWLAEARAKTAMYCFLFIVVGAGAYGAAMGSWRSPTQAIFTGLKLPLAILGTTLGNALLNAMLAPLLGLNFTFRQSQMAILLSFTITAIVLGGFSPLAAFVVFNTPPLTLASETAMLHRPSLKLPDVVVPTSRSRRSAKRGAVPAGIDTLTDADVPAQPEPCDVTRMKFTSLLVNVVPPSTLVRDQIRAVKGAPARPAKDHVTIADRG